MANLSVEVVCRDLKPVKEVFAILNVMLEDPRIAENVKLEYKKRLISIKLEE